MPLLKGDEYLYDIVYSNNIKDRLHEKHQEVNDVVNDFLEETNIKGITISVIKDGEIHYSTGGGFSNEKEKLHDESYHTMHRWASTTKSLVSLSAVIMQREGILNLDTPINEYWDKYQSCSGLLFGSRTNLSATYQKPLPAPSNANIKRSFIYEFWNSRL